MSPAPAKLDYSFSHVDGLVRNLKLPTGARVQAVCAAVLIEVDGPDAANPGKYAVYLPSHFEHVLGEQWVVETVVMAAVDYYLNWKPKDPIQ